MKTADDMNLPLSCRITSTLVNMPNVPATSVCADAPFQARKAGFEEGVGSAEESSQIQDELDKIDKGLAKIGETLRESKDFWQGVDRKLASVSLAFAGQQAKDPPDGVTTGPEASPVSVLSYPANTDFRARNFVLNATRGRSTLAYRPSIRQQSNTPTRKRYAKPVIEFSQMQ
jgi:hypothetical protein